MPVVEVDFEDDIFLDVYKHLVHDNEDFIDIDFLYGGRDSGKSRHVAMQLVISCMNEEYFKCLLIRKVLNTVRDSQYALIKSIIEDWELDHLFKFNDTRLEIICKANKNGFYGRGLDDVGRIKSFNNPSHCWIEEGNQIDNTDFVVILTSLRTNGQRVKTYFTFNPECEVNYTDFWLYKEFFAHTTKLSFVWEQEVELPPRFIGDPPRKAIRRVRATHSTYLDNPYCPVERAALYEGYKNSKNNSYWYQTYTLGLWGFRKTGGAFWKCFDEIIHSKPRYYKKNTAIHATVDNNVFPYITIGLWQVDLVAKEISQVHELPCESPDNTAAKAAKKLIKWLEQIDHNGPLFIYGDPSANAASTEDDEGQSFFDKFFGILKKMGIPYTNRVGKSHPGVSISADFINDIYENHYEGWTIVINSTCRKSIEDYTMVKEDINGTMLKKKEKDKETGRTFERYGHFSDTKRYFITKLLPVEFSKFGDRRKKYYAR